MAVSSFASPASAGPQSGAGAARAGAAFQRRYRLVDGAGNPHPVLDDLYDSLEIAWAEALSWWGDQQRPTPCETSRSLLQSAPVDIGIEVSTSCGSWRTLRHPGS